MSGEREEVRFQAERTSDSHRPIAGRECIFRHRVVAAVPHSAAQSLGGRGRRERAP